MRLIHKIWLWPCFVGALALAETDVEGQGPSGGSEDLPSPDLIQKVEPPAPPSMPPSVQEAELLAFSLRFDTSFSAGSPSQQGFFLPGVRLGAFGVIDDNISYRLALGQTREFTSVLLPQLLPVEGYINISSQRAGHTMEPSYLNWKVGLFTPGFHPFWTPDLSDLDLPDYAETHKALFLSRDIGTEIAYEFIPTDLKIGVGAFNGSGLLSLNSNNSKAFNMFFQKGIGLGDWRVVVAGAAYTLFQSTKGSINYKSDWLALLTIGLERTRSFILYADFFYGTFEDSTRSISPNGQAFTAIVRLDTWLDMWARFENLDDAPEPSTQPSQHLQVGPIFYLGDHIKVFSYYENLRFSSGTLENAFQIRLRLVI